MVGGWLVVDGFRFVVDWFGFVVDGFRFVIDWFRFVVDRFGFMVDGFRFVVDGLRFVVDRFVRSRSRVVWLFLRVVGGALVGDLSHVSIVVVGGILHVLGSSVRQLD